jgi:hypothetical protein
MYVFSEEPADNATIQYFAGVFLFNAVLPIPEIESFFDYYKGSPIYKFSIRYTVCYGTNT